ncbi:class I tRNA ligase family protein [Patescibacteria group bacterium]|nr:class I tRNA ligase family protein [Patescibacteria group bacterium]
MNKFRDIILCEKDFHDPNYILAEWIDAPVVIESQDGEYITLWMDMAKKQYVVRGQQEATNGSNKQQEEKTSPEIVAYNSRCRKQSLSDKENFHTLTDEEKIDRYIDTEKRLAFISHAPINWCPSCMTALANEDLDGNVCERCGTTIERRKMRQWMIRITDYAQRLLDGLDLLPERQDNIKAMQRHWIGRSEGTIFAFQVANHSLSFDVYTTRIDTVYGVTFVSLAPEHALVEQITTDTQRDAVMAYVEETKSKTDIQRQEAKEKTGVWIGAYAVNPFTNEQIPIRVADYVLMDYGTGAVMAVPAHDERDWEFAEKFGLEVKQVV